MKKRLLYSIVLHLFIFLGYAQNKNAIKTQSAILKPASVPEDPPPCDDCPLGYQWNRDADGDGYGNPEVYVYSQTKPNGYVADQSDLDDTNPYITNVQTQTFYRDLDGDTYGNPSASVNYSIKPTGYVTNNADCNDADATINPNTIWYRDADADGYGISTTTTVSCTQPTGYVRNASDYNDATANITNIAPSTFYRDADGDTFGSPTVTVYCSVRPTGYVTNNSDYDDSTANITNIAPSIFYRDADGDTFGSPTVTVYYSVKPTGYVTNNTDCNDADVTLNPNTVWYRDVDGDGYGISTTTLVSCTQPAGYVRNSSDYNDTTVNITNIAPTTFYRDADGDTFGSPAVTVYYSVKPTGYVTNNTDCNDADNTINPNTIWYRDADADGYGISTTTSASCTQPAGYVRNSSDYNDTTANITNIAPSTFYQDTDGDGFGNAAVSIYYSVKPAGYAVNSTDCNDADVTLNPNTKWYLDNDLDSLGDPLTFVTQCAKPSGNYVLNNTDNCPLVSGTASDCTSIIVPAPSQDQNYIITKAYKEPATTAFILPDADKARVNITYFDGIGRPIQQIANQQSNSGKDIIVHVEYDTFGKQIKEYLPFKSATGNMTFDVNSKANVTSYYGTPNVSQNGNPNLEATANPFSQKDIETSPLNRIMKQAAPGNDWKSGSGHEIKMDYQTNIDNEVKAFTATTTWNTTTGLYDAALGNGNGTLFYLSGQLYKTVTYDENTLAAPIETAGAIVEFKNKEGQIVLKRTYDAGVKLDTYYIYDDYGNLTYVIPPKADGTITATTLNDLCYQYKYDYRNRLIEKKLPGKQWEFIVYDKLDRVVAIGPSASPFSDLTSIGWTVTKYDAFNRPVVTAWWPSATITSAARKTLQDAQNALTANFSETKISTATNTTINGVDFRYSNLAWPTTAFHVLAINYFDDYNYPGAPVIPAIVEGQTVYYNTTVKPKGLATGTWVRVLESSILYKNELSYSLYDAKSRPIRSYTQNHLGGYTYTDTNLKPISGEVQYTITYHKRTAAATEVKTKEVFTYSPQGRLLTETHQINADTPQLLASNTYDELGQLISKKVGNTAALPLQKVDFSYNIRGWMTGINNVASLTQAGDPKDLFAFKINYNTSTSGISGVKALYNGNIAETLWNTADVQRSYGYKYDNLNRLTDATFQKTGVTTNAYNESLSYDKNGNILSLIRNGSNETAAQIDNLVYSYGTTNVTNQLTKVIDNAPAASKVNGFTDSAANTVDDYTYDLNGNMISDANKNITSITYNHLNLPTKITFSATGSIVYIYNANGQKVQKVVTATSPASTTTTEYLGEYQYLNTVLQFFPTAEGYVEAVTPSSFKYVYQYKDHLGNLRLSYKDSDGNGSIISSEILEENNYYPFGLKHTGYGPAIVSSNSALKYKFQTKELQDELGLNLYDFGLRQYDPALGRMFQVDPVAHHGQSPYTAFDNNPVFWADPDGANTVDPIKDKTTVISSSVDKNNVTSITETTTNTTTTTNDDGSVSVSYSSTSITNKVDAEGNITKGTSVTQSSGTISKNANGKISTTIGKTTTREAKSGDASSTFSQWTNTVSNYNKSNEKGIYNIDKINKTADYTTVAGKAGVSVLGTFAGFDGMFSMLSTNTKALLGVVGGVKGSDSLMGTIGSGLKEAVGANNKYMIVYGVEHIQNGTMMREMKTPGGQKSGSRYSVGPTSWQDLWKMIKNAF